MPLPRIARSTVATLALAFCATLIAACGGSATTTSTSSRSVVTVGAGAESPAAALGYPELATKNTSRLSSTDSVGTAAAVSAAVFPGGTSGQRPPAVALAPSGDWRAALAASMLMAPPVGAPLIFTEGGDLPAVSRAALTRIAPTGLASDGGTQALRLGTAGDAPGLQQRAIAGSDPFTLAANVDAYRTQLTGQPSHDVVIVTADDPGYAMPAAAWAAKSGDALLFTHRAALPAATRDALARHPRARIYLLGPRAAISSTVAEALSALGTVTRIAGPDPTRTAIAFARFVDGSFGWRLVDPGHGLVFASPARPADAGAAAALSASGTYGPLLLTDAGGGLPQVLADYLRDIRPGYSSDPVRGVYNHGWIVGDPSAVSVDTQATIDGLLEIAPAKP